MLPLWLPVEANGWCDGWACRIQPWPVWSCITLLLICFGRGVEEEWKLGLMAAWNLAWNSDFLIHMHILFLSCKGFTQYSAKAQPVALYTPFFTSVLPPNTAHAPVSYSQPESGSLCLWPLSALQQFLSLCPSSPVAKVGPVDKPLLDTDLYFSEQGLCSLFQIASYKTSLK